MWCKLFSFDFKRSVCSRVNVGLIFLLFCLTIAGLMVGHLKYKEMMLVRRGNDKVVSISNIGGFLAKAENVLDRSFRYDYGETNRQAQYRFVYSRLVDLWPIIAFLLVLVYGTFFVTREREMHIIDAFCSGPMRKVDYYWAKAAAGAAYWALLSAGYAALLLVYALIQKGLSSALIVALMAGAVLFWIYCLCLWFLYLLISFGVAHAARTGGVLLAVMIIISLFIPMGIQIGARVLAGPAPQVPYLVQSPGILAFVSERDRTEADRVAIEMDQQELNRYSEAVRTYFQRGISMEERLTYFSPPLVFQRLVKSLFRPELTDFARYLDGQRGDPSVKHFLHKQAGYAVFLGVILGILAVLPPLVMYNAERDFKRMKKITKKYEKPA